MMPNGYLLIFVNAKRLCLFCLMRQKHCWNYFAFNQSYLVKGKIAPVTFASRGKIKIHGFTLADQDWIGLVIFKNFADQDWIRFNFIRSRLDSDWKISQSTHLCQDICLR